MELVKTTEEVICRCGKCMSRCVFPYEDTPDEPRLASISSDTLNIVLACPHTPRQPAVIFVGGFLDTMHCKMLVLAEQYSTQNPQQDVWYVTYGSEKSLRKIITAYNRDTKKVIITGHSRVGDMAAYTLVNNPSLHVDLLLTLDPVSKKGAPVKTVNMGQWVNIFVDYKLSRLSKSNLLAIIGGHWENAERADVNITQQEWGEAPSNSGVKKLQDLHHADIRWMFNCKQLRPHWLEVLPETDFRQP